MFVALLYGSEFILMMIFILVVFLLFLRFAKKLAVNLILGFIALTIINKVTRINIPINETTLIVVALFGLVGVAVLAIIYTFS